MSNLVNVRVGFLQFFNLLANLVDVCNVLGVLETKIFGNGLASGYLYLATQLIHAHFNLDQRSNCQSLRKYQKKVTYQSYLIIDRCRRSSIPM